MEHAPPTARGGLSGLYRGVSAPLLGGALENGVNYCAFRQVRELIAGSRETQVCSTTASHCDTRVTRTLQS